MSIVLEFTIDGDAFTLGEVLSEPSAMSVELERIVPAGSELVPFLWVTGDDHERFENVVSAHRLVGSLHALTTVGDRRLYRIEWESPPGNLLEAIADANLTILEARRNEHQDWRVRLRGPDQAAITQFHEDCNSADIPIAVRRIYPLEESGDPTQRFGLSEEQHEALLLALRSGYFETPRTVALDELAEDLGITRQALSSRIRRGSETVLRRTLVPSEEDRE